MIPKTLPEIIPHPSSVFIDNLMLCSADRLLTAHYPDSNSDLLARNREYVPVLIDHDLLNLSLLVEAVICHEQLCVNAEYIDRWNPSIQNATLKPLQTIVQPVFWPPHERKQVEDGLSTSIRPFASDSGIHALAEVVYHSTHHPVQPNPTTRNVEREHLLPFEEGTTAWGTPFYLHLGLAFYLFSSQALGIPYKPSVLRASMLRSSWREAHQAIQFPAAEIALAFLEKTREAVVGEYFDKILEFNLLEARIPCLLAAILSTVKSASDIIPTAIEIRESPEGCAFREWSASFAQTIQHGDLRGLGELTRQLHDVCSRVNKLLKLNLDDATDVSLGWGPASVTMPFSLPGFLHRPIHYKRHLWFLHNIYSQLAKLARISDHIQRILIQPLPQPIRDQMLQLHLDWPSIEARARTRDA